MHSHFKILSFTILLFFSFQIITAQQSSLSVEKIMKDPKWMGTFPSNVKWAENGGTLYFNYNLQEDPSDSLYKIQLNAPEKIVKVGQKEIKTLTFNGTYNKDKSAKLYTKDGKLMLFSSKDNASRILLDLGENVRNAEFLKDENLVSFIMKNNLYLFHLKTGFIEKITNIKSGNEPEKDEKLSTKDEWLENENLGLLEVVNQRKIKREESAAYYNSIQKDPTIFYTGNKEVSNLHLSPDGKFATFNLTTPVKNKYTDVPNYADASGYTVNLPARSKVGNEIEKEELLIYSVENDSVYVVKTDGLPGITDLPDYTKDYPEKNWEKEVREVIAAATYFSEDGNRAIVNIRSQDNKDRWIASLDLATGVLKSLDRQRDEAWINGPGIGYAAGYETMGWLPDNKNIYFQSEESGYSHLYVLNVDTGNKKQLTKGSFEVFDPFISKDGKSWFLTTSEVGPEERHFYKMPLMGGKMEKLTSMTGNNDVYLSPDEKRMAILYSYSNKPWELFIKKTQQKDNATQLTSGLSEEFKAYLWRDPEIVNFKAEDGAMVPARIYKPSATAKNGAAVIFVHGAGYLQNAHKWWSSYFREYMFHNLLTDLGYTVLDIDYRGSAGYGRDWRTAIYRHMGGKDLSDQVDGATYLVKELGIDKDKVGIYGGSYGGFITLMAMFNEPETFTSGAALRSVTDWAHYNHGYTSNILNNPVDDPIAYKRSSPIYFAEGLKGNLLIEHGMLDVNVHFQDVVRLSQRLIELGKNNWELAVYPLEDHGFVEPSSWTDEYKRILKLFNETLLKE